MLSLAQRLRAKRSLWRPPAKLSLSAWADRHFYLSPESAAEPGRWKTLPYQRGIMDAITDPAVERVSMMKSARVGYTKMINATIGYYMHQDPCPIMVVQPTVDDAKGYSKEEIAPMIRDCDVLASLIRDVPKKTSTTLLSKQFPGGILSMVGANSGTGFRRVSRRVVIFDEVDGYPPSAGSEGDQIRLGIRRTESYWNRKIIAGSTPLVAGASRIEEMFEAGDQRRYHVPCPQCGHFDILVFRENVTRGHFMRWPDGQPEQAYFVCKKNGCIIEHRQKQDIVAAGRWEADAPFRGHASFQIWSAYSFSVNATWGQIASEFVDANKAGADKLRTFVNTALGETWHDRGEAPDWERIYHRRETYPIGQVPDGVIAITAGVDVQKDRFVCESVGWTRAKESFSIEYNEIHGDTSDSRTWAKLDEFLAREYPKASGGMMPINLMAIDSGYNTQQVYGWARQHGPGRVIAIKGVATARALLNVPKAVDVRQSGKRVHRGNRVWPVGVSIAKAELYGWLRLPPPEPGEEFPPGYCHFPEYPPEYFRQLTAEHLVGIKKRTGRMEFEWQIQPGRENHVLDARVYARAAIAQLGIDRLAPAPSTHSKPTATPAADRPRSINEDEPRRPRQAPREGRRDPKNWFKPRR